MKKIDYSSKGYIAVFLLFLSVSGIVTAEPVGKVVYTFGDVSAIAANGDIRQINKGDEVFSGDTSYIREMVVYKSVLLMVPIYPYNPIVITKSRITNMRGNRMAVNWRFTG
ncbi:MAG: hypothetical protein IIA06_01615 [Proteobacteria bacterium]|nr:hypothetical protein [Pseudomonadota bacterium]